MKTFAIYIVYNEKSETYQAGAFGLSGIWARSLPAAIEDLLNKLTFRGIEWANLDAIPQVHYDPEGNS
jgi:hypothetical protein